MAAEGIAEVGTLLLGPRTYEDFASVRPHMQQENPFTVVMNNFRKYVASTTLQEPLLEQDDDHRRGDHDLPAGRADDGED